MTDRDRDLCSNCGRWRMQHTPGVEWCPKGFAKWEPVPLYPINEEQYRALLIKHGYIEPWQPTPDGGFSFPDEAP